LQIDIEFITSLTWEIKALLLWKMYRLICRITLYITIHRNSIAKYLFYTLYYNSCTFECVYVIYLTSYWFSTSYWLYLIHTQDILFDTPNLFKQPFVLCYPLLTHFELPCKYLCFLWRSMSQVSNPQCFISLIYLELDRILSTCMILVWN
jgi:hypothetical protein